MTSPHGKTLPDKFLDAARQMAWHFWPALPASDSLLVPNPVPAGFLEYVESLGIEPPIFRMEPDPDRIFTPFGWNREAGDMNRRYRKPSPHPDRAATAIVNSREFGAKLERELFPEGHGGFAPLFCREAGALRSWLGEAGSGHYVAKGNHGFGGLGQMRFALPGPSPEIFGWLERILRRHGGLVLEAEHRIEAEFGVLFRLGEDGKMSSPRIHALLAGKTGGFAGVLLDANGVSPQRRVALENTAEKIASRLHGEKYFGPVGFDAYAWKDGDDHRFRPFSDLNARCTMAYPVYGLAHRYSGRAAAVLQLSVETLHLPESHAGLRRKLGDIHFNPSRGTGVFLITPLGLGLHRHSLAIIGRDGAELGHWRERSLEVLGHG